MSVIIETRNYKCTTKGVYKRHTDKETGNESWVWLSRPIDLVDVYRVMDTGELFWEIRFECNDGWQKDIIHRTDATERNFSVLLKKGADVATWKTKSIINYLIEAEAATPISLQHRQLGWTNHKRINYFAHQQLYSASSKEKSDYIGEFNIRKSGNYKRWLDVLKKAVVGHPEMELALCLGFSAILVGYINRILKLHTDSMIFHIAGNSTTGKTSAATVAVSGFGDPKEGTRSLIQSFNGTDNALTNLMANNNGVPIVCDETSLSLMGTQKLVNVLYTWAKNISKARLDKNSQAKPRSEWSTTIITTGEGSLLDQINQNEGIRARVFELKNLHWTKSAKHSNVLVKELSKNYGHGVEPFVTTLLNYLPKEVQKAWENETAEIEEAMPQSKFKDRISKKFALITMTAKLLNETFDLNLNIDGIRALLVQQELESIEEREIGPKALELIREWLLMNRRHFYINSHDVSETQTIWGRMNINKNKQETEVFILPSIFKQMLEEKGFTDYSVVLRELDSMGVLITTTDATQKRYSIRRVIKGFEGSKNGVTTYGIKLEGAFIHTVLTPGEVQRQPRKGTNQPKQTIESRESELVDIDEM